MPETGSVARDEMMMSQKEIYKGLIISIDEKKHELNIENKKIDIRRLRGGSYITPYLPYTEYNSIFDLSKAIIDFVPNFYTNTKQEKN